MAVLTGAIGPLGAIVEVKVMQGAQRVAALKKAGLPFATPQVIVGLVDTGASCSAIDRIVVAGLNLQHRGIVAIHTPSTGAGFVQCNQYDISLVLGESQPDPLELTLPVIESDFASQGFLALIGRDVLRRCVLTFDGPSGRFTLTT